MNTFLLEIITPEKIAYSNQVEMIKAASADGIIGILPGHEPIFTKLIEGEVKIVQKEEESFLAIGGGFLEVTPEKVILLVTSAFHADQINEQEMLAAKKRAEDALSSKPEGAAFIEAQALFRRSEVALKVLRKHKYSGKRPQLPS